MTEKRLYEEYIARNAGQNGRIGNKVAQGAETIEAMLNAGVDLLLDSLKRPAVEGWMDSVRATRIAQRLGKTTGAFFHWWPDQQAFRSDLLGKILSQLEHARRDKVEHVVEELPEDRTPEIVLAAIGELALGASLEGDDFDMTTLLLATRHSDERIIPSLRQQYITLSEATAGLYGELLDLTGRQITPPFTPEHFATSILAIAQGFGNRAAVESAPQEEITQSRTFNDLLDSRSPSDHERSFGLLVTELAYGMSTSPEDTADKS